MKFPILFSALALLVGCAAQSDNIEPNKVVNDADIDFSKPVWVNEYQYDGVFSIQRSMPNTNNIYTRYYCTYRFNGADDRKFSNINSKYPLEDGFWMDAKTRQTLLYDYLSKTTDIYGVVSLNDVKLSQLERRLNFYYPFNDPYKQDLIKYDATKGLTWKVEDIYLSDDQNFKSFNNLSSTDKPSFIHTKPEIKVFPDEVKLEPSYRISKTDKTLTINFEGIKNADAIYFRFDKNGIKDETKESANILGAYGFIRYLKGDATSITIKRAELEIYVWNAITVDVEVTAIKFYTGTSGNRKFLYKNTAVTNASIILE